MIELHRIDHVGLRVTDVAEASARWSAQFGLIDRSVSSERAVLACDDEPCALELVRAGADGRPGAPGCDHVAFELAPGCSPDDAAAHLASCGVDHRRFDGGIITHDPDGTEIDLLTYRPPADPRPPHARPASGAPLGHPRKLGHVNFLTGDLSGQVDFYSGVLGMGITDRLGDEGVWLHVNADHHVMALVDKGYPHLHHFALELVDIGHMRMALDHLGRHGRWLGWGPTRHGIGGNIASYVRIPEERCFVELYCDMEQLSRHHQPRDWPDDRFSSNTWGPLPPRSYFRFDEEAIESERESAEMRGIPLTPLEVQT
ncbi:MAG TPA: VOC family protein [Solirubrobacteraceae bacterium]|nr:VOC family protein [Solirubrobacteraceae bacterium]